MDVLDVYVGSTWYLGTTNPKRNTYEYVHSLSVSFTFTHLSVIIAFI